MILLTGATGTIGKTMMSLLPQFAGEFRVLARDPSRLPAASNGTVEVVAGGFEDEALDVALKGVDKALLLIGNGPTQLDLERRFIDRAVAAGVAHVVKISAIGAAPGATATLKRFHGQAEAYLKASGLTYTIVRPNFFAQNLQHMASTVKGQNKFFMPMGNGRVGIIDAGDVAEFALKVLTTDGHENQLYDISGPELLSFTDIAGQMSEVTGRTIQYVDIPNQSFKEAMLGSGAGQWYVDAVAGLFELTAKGESELMTDTFFQVVGHLPTSLHSYISTNEAAFKP